MIKLKGIRKSFGRNEVLKGIDLSVEKGQVVAILGPSGSGKTTLLRCLNYLEKPAEGSIHISGFSADCDPSPARKFIRFARKRRWCFSSTICFATKPRWRT